MTIDREPSEVSIADRRLPAGRFQRSRALPRHVPRRVRCHLVSFNLTAREPEPLASIARSLDIDVQNRSSRSAPECVRDMPSLTISFRELNPRTQARKRTVPVRIVVAKDGSVSDVHVIRATRTQQRNIEEALVRRHLNRSGAAVRRTQRRRCRG